MSDPNPNPTTKPQLYVAIILLLFVVVEGAILLWKYDTPPGEVLNGVERNQRLMTRQFERLNDSMNSLRSELNTIRGNQEAMKVRPQK